MIATQPYGHKTHQYFYHTYTLKVNHYTLCWIQFYNWSILSTKPLLESLILFKVCLYSKILIIPSNALQTLSVHLFQIRI
jgi:hypothetical protein